MYKQVCYQIAALFFCTFLVRPLQADPPQLPEGWQTQTLYELSRTTKAIPGFTAAAKADAFATWMANEDWASFEMHDIYNLFEWVGADSLDPHHFSARWNGFLTAPATGAYTLRQVRVYKGVDSRLKVSIDGHIVLDSTSGGSDDSRFASSAVQLTAGQAVPIQVDLVHITKNVTPIYDFSEGAPMVVLTWKTGQGSEAIIPSTAYSPPQGFGEAGAHGLKGQYFGNTEFGDLRLTRLDPALDLVWSWPPVAPLHDQETAATLNACKSAILNGDFLTESAAKGSVDVFSYNMWRIALRMRASERQQLVAVLKDRPAVLTAMTPEAMGRLSQAIYMLPRGEHIDLLGKWALANPQPHCLAGKFPGWGKEGSYYQNQNTDFYWLMGRFMHGPYAKDVDTLCDQYLVRPDGECNLAVSYAAAFASRLNGTSDRFFHRLDEHINDKTLAGDKLMTWLVARAYAKGAVPGNLQPLAGFSDLESAYTVAENNDQKFWALQEMVARLSSVNKGDKAKALIEQHRSEFTSQEQLQAMANWITSADALATTYAQHQAAQKQTAQTNYKTELERRRQAAVTRGDTAAANRFGGLISAGQSAPEK